MSRRTVLLIDDEMDFLEIMGARIENWGHDVIKAQSGKEGIDVLKGRNPDIIVLDYRMPDMDGISTLKAIRKIDVKIPVIILTAHPDVDSIKDAEELGVSAFIPKLSIYSDTQSTLKAAINMTEKRPKKE